jgi:hypothetical protein
MGLMTYSYLFGWDAAKERILRYQAIHNGHHDKNISGEHPGAGESLRISLMHFVTQPTSI